MSAARKLSDLRNDVRELADMETSDATTDFVDNTELDRRINEAAYMLYNMLVDVRGQGYYYATTSFTKSSSLTSQFEFDLPDDFFQLLGVRVTDGNFWAQLKSWEYQELARLKQADTWGPAVSLWRYRYRLQNKKVAILPSVTNASHTFHLDYVPHMTKLVADDDSFDGFNGFEKWIALTVAIDLVTKEEDYEKAQALMANRQKLEMMIQKLGAERDAGQPFRIVDTRRDGPGPWFIDGPPFWGGGDGS